jgi:hypothetical protein
VRSELLALNPWRITINAHTIVANFNQDFGANRHSNLFQGQTNRILIYWPNHTGETRLSKQEEAEEEEWKQPKGFSWHFFHYKS